jgi:hypothetical protein
MVSIQEFDSCDVGSNPTPTTLVMINDEVVSMVCSSNGSGRQAFYLQMRVRFSYRLQLLEWFVGVMVNIPDCRSGATGSIPVRTAMESIGS